VDEFGRNVLFDFKHVILDIPIGACISFFKLACPMDKAVYIGSRIAGVVPLLPGLIEGDKRLIALSNTTDNKLVVF